MARSAFAMGRVADESRSGALPYRSGRCRAWAKIKNPASPAMLRIQDGTW
jgi:hypothetical protein